MKVSVFEVRLVNGSVGSIMMPSVENESRAEVSEVFRKKAPGSVAWCGWEYNMWITGTIDGPIVLTAHEWTEGRRYVFK